MKIAIINPNYPPTICGVGDHTYHTIQAMVQAGVEVHLICAADQKPERTTNPSIYPIIEQWNSAGFQTAVDKVAAIQPDWIYFSYVPHGYDPRGLPFPVLGFIKKLSRLGIPIATIFHEVRIRRGTTLLTKAMSAIQTYIARRIVKHSTQVATSIDFYADILSNKTLTKQNKGDKTADKINLVPIGTGILPIETPPSVKIALKQRYNISDKASIVATFGNRNVTPYLSAFDQLFAKNPDLIWLLCGRTSTPKTILESRPYFRTTGELPADTLYQSLCLADCLFMPEPVSTTGEGGSSNKSTALACALSVGAPVIGVKGDLNNSLLKHGDNILLVDVLNAQSLFEALDFCLHTEGGKRLGRNAKILYYNALDWSVVGRQYLKMMGIEIKKVELTTV
jgi:glycosyltransferase involved in cell wall biosynthesis